MFVVKRISNFQQTLSALRPVELNLAVILPLYTYPFLPTPNFNLASPHTSTLLPLL